MATGWSSGSDLGTHARNRVGACHLLRRCNDLIFKIRLYHPNSLLNFDPALFYRGSLAFREASLTLPVA